MKIWLSKNSEVPVREQLITQIMLGIVSGDLPVGKRLPSTKEISNRFGVHSNTVSNAYQKLAEQGLLEFKKGSGFYVREFEDENLTNDLKLEKLIGEFFKNAEKLGFTIEEINKRLKQSSIFRGAEKILVVESDAVLREILIEEIQTATSWQIDGAGLAEFERTHHKADAITVAMIDEKSKLKNLNLSAKINLYLNARSVPDSMTGEKRPSENNLIAVVSGWQKFLLWSKTMLLAAQIEPESLILRATDTENWRNGLKSASLIICDSLTAKHFQNDERVKIFQIISDDSLKELTKFSKQFTEEK
jgi:DNA-binding transcriptional regulator YhcF (GntR family)